MNTTKGLQHANIKHVTPTLLNTEYNTLKRFLRAPSGVKYILVQIEYFIIRRLVFFLCWDCRSINNRRQSDKQKPFFRSETMTYNQYFVCNPFWGQRGRGVRFALGRDELPVGDVLDISACAPALSTIPAILVSTFDAIMPGMRSNIYSDTFSLPFINICSGARSRHDHESFLYWYLDEYRSGDQRASILGRAVGFYSIDALNTEKLTRF